MSTDKPLTIRQPCDVGVIFALSIEAGGFEDRMSGALAIKGPPFRVREGGIAGRSVVTMTSGPGQHSAQRATETLIAGHRPRWIISAGFAGGLNDNVKRGDIVMADSLVNAAGERLSIDFKIERAVLERTPGVHVGQFFSIDRIVRTASEKRSLGETHVAVAVDMESFAVAHVCQRERIRCMCIRVISDGMDDELPRDIERLLRARSAVRRVGEVIGTVFRRPSSVKDLWKLKEHAIVASDRLAKFLEGVIAQLPR